MCKRGADWTLQVEEEFEEDQVENVTALGLAMALERKAAFQALVFYCFKGKFILCEGMKEAS